MRNNNMNNMNQQQGMRNNNINQQQNMMNNPYINNNQNMNQNQNLGANPYINTVNSKQGFNTNDFVKGAVIGAGITFLLTNKTSQKAILNGFAKVSDLFNIGMEEIKERIEDAKASMQDNSAN